MQAFLKENGHANRSDISTISYSQNNKRKFSILFPINAATYNHLYGNCYKTTANNISADYLVSQMSHTSDLPLNDIFHFYELIQSDARMCLLLMPEPLPWDGWLTLHPGRNQSMRSIL